MKKENDYTHARKMLVEELRREGITDQAVLKAMDSIPRHLFLPEDLWASAYENRPLAIEHGQTISQPYIVARMTMAICQGQHLSKVLEVGTGSGYQAAILSQLVDTVYTIERIGDLSLHAE